MLHSAAAVLSGQTNNWAFAAFRPFHPSIKTISSLTFYMNQPPPLKMKQCHRPHLACQASQGTVSLSKGLSEKIVAPRVGIIMGSDSDLPAMKNAVEILEMFGVTHEVQIVSAHRTPEVMFSYASSAWDRGIQVIIAGAGAGGAAHLPGMVAALTPLPVIGVPVHTSFLDGLDSLLSIVQMPKGVPVATVAIDNSTNAGLLTVRMLGVVDDNLLSRMSQYQEDQKEIVMRKGENLSKIKIGHITISDSGPSLGNIKSNLAKIVEGKRLDDKTAVAPQVGIIMGSDSDLPVMKNAAEILEIFGVAYELRIVSAHRTPEMMFSYASSARDRGIQVIIAGAGGAAHLPGMVAAITPLHVIGVPMRASSLDGLDSLLSIVQMPKGVPVAAVGINNATNAGLLAVRNLGVADDNLLSRMSQYQEDQKEIVLRKGDKLEKHGWESYLNST